VTTWNILYRGSLSSCNYDCGYCPFAKTSNTRAELAQDQRELQRFVAWVERQKTRIGILFTPWGEALIHDYYRSAIVALSHCPNVYRVSIQTNLSGPIAQLSAAHRETLALWTTFHPSQTSLGQFLSRCAVLDAAGIGYSVGVVGLRENFESIQELRQRLRPEIYLWVNAYKRRDDYYTADEIDGLHAVDPYFHWNLRAYPSKGQPCSAGETSFTVAGNGDMRRCHFLKTGIGNIYEDGFEARLKPRNCTAATCSCHIGYIHRPALKLDHLYGPGLLERRPMHWPRTRPEFSAAQS
jgi:MoaA/NifB/PqqE/SkfB family radical SAM enzyme